MMQSLKTEFAHIFCFLCSSHSDSWSTSSVIFLFYFILPFKHRQYVITETFGCLRERQQTFLKSDTNQCVIYWNLTNILLIIKGQNWWLVAQVFMSTALRVRSQCSNLLLKRYAIFSTTDVLHIKAGWSNHNQTNGELRHEKLLDRLDLLSYVQYHSCNIIKICGAFYAKHCILCCMHCIFYKKE